MKFFVIAGEASGDLHGSNLIKELKILEPNAQFRGFGGDLMQAQGVVLVKHISKLAYMGFVDVLLHLPTILGNIKTCKEDIQNWKPDVIIFIDYPGFNLRICKWAKKQKIKTIYYISPKLWAWKESRVNIIKKSVDKMLVILPFEKAFYKKHQMEVDYLGHPLLDVVKDFKAEKIEGIVPNKKTLALLPGSRIQEISRMLPTMFEVANSLENVESFVAMAPGISESFYQTFNPPKHIHFIRNQTYSLLSVADTALVTSGTATLEAALFNVPQAVCYKADALSVWLARKLIKVKYISLVNLILNKAAIKEFIQKDLNRQTLITEVEKLLNEDSYRNQILNSYSELEKSLGGAGASKRIAESIHHFLKN